MEGVHWRLCSGFTLDIIRESYVMLGMEVKSDVCRVSTIPPLYYFFSLKNSLFKGQEIEHLLGHMLVCV